VRAPRSRTGRLGQWRKSATFRQIARESAKTNLAKFRTAPRCGAKRRDGEPCCKPVVKGRSRCRLHGGVTPRGLQYHVVQWPVCSTPAGEAKFNRKLRARNRYAEKRAARLAAMTDAERERYLAWCRTHPAGGSRASRRAKSDQTRQNEALRRLIAEEPSLRTTNPELNRIKKALDAAKARLAALETRNAKPSNEDEGIFA
jgi:hypothetical protein